MLDNFPIRRYSCSFLILNPGFQMQKGNFSLIICYFPLVAQQKEAEMEVRRICLSLQHWEEPVCKKQVLGMVFFPFINKNRYTSLFARGSAAVQGESMIIPPLLSSYLLLLFSFTEFQVGKIRQSQRVSKCFTGLRSQ